LAQIIPQLNSTQVVLKRYLPDTATLLRGDDVISDAMKMPFTDKDGHLTTDF